MANVHHQNIEIKSVSERMWYIRLGVLSLRNRTTHRSLNRDKFCVCTPNKKNDITFDSYASNLDYYSFSCKQAGKKKIKMYRSTIVSFFCSHFAETETVSIEN